MKNLLILISILLSFTACVKKDRYVIHGNLRCVNAQEAYLMEMSPLGEMVVTDSAPIRNGDFKFRGHVEYPTMRFIKVGSCRPFDVFVENEEINIRGSVLYPDEITVTGSNSQAELNFLMSEYKSISNKQNSALVKISNAKKQNDLQLVKKLTAHYESLPDSLLLITEQFVASNPTSIGAAYFVCSLSESFSISKMENIITKFDPSIANSQYVKYLPSHGNSEWDRWRRTSTYPPSTGKISPWENIRGNTSTSISAHHGVTRRKSGTKFYWTSTNATTPSDWRYSPSPSTRTMTNGATSPAAHPSCLGNRPPTFSTGPARSPSNTTSTKYPAVC